MADFVVVASIGLIARTISRNALSTNYHTRSASGKTNEKNNNNKADAIQIDKLLAGLAMVMLVIMIGLLMAPSPSSLLPNYCTANDDDIVGYNTLAFDFRKRVLLASFMPSMLAYAASSPPPNSQHLTGLASSGSSSSSSSGGNTGGSSASSLARSNAMAGANAKQGMNQLLKFIFSNYDKELMPTAPVYVSLDILLLKVKTTVEREGIFESVVALMIEWSDYRMVWDPTEYDNVTVLAFDSEKIWLPDIAMTNSADHLYSISRDTRFVVRVTNNGLFKFVPTGTARTWCDLHLLTFPFDIQTCSMEFESWSLNSDTMRFNPSASIIVDSNFLSTQWTLCNKNATVFDVLYNFSGETFSRIKFDFTVRRKSTFYLINLVFPCATLSLIQLLVFAIPSLDSSSDRIGFGTTNLLTLVVFQTIVTAEMPKTSDAVTALSKYIIGLIILSAIGILESVCVERLRRISYKPPPRLALRFIKYVPFMLRRKSSAFNDASFDISAYLRHSKDDVASSDKQGHRNRHASSGGGNNNNNNKQIELRYINVPINSSGDNNNNNNNIDHSSSSLSLAAASHHHHHHRHHHQQQQQSKSSHKQPKQKQYSRQQKKQQQLRYPSIETDVTDRGGAVNDRWVQFCEAAQCDDNIPLPILQRSPSTIHSHMMMRRLYGSAASNNNNADNNADTSNIRIDNSQDSLSMQVDNNARSPPPLDINKIDSEDIAYIEESPYTPYTSHRGATARHRNTSSSSANAADVNTTVNYSRRKLSRFTAAKDHRERREFIEHQYIEQWCEIATAVDLLCFTISSISAVVVPFSLFIPLLSFGDGCTPPSTE